MSTPTFPIVLCDPDWDYNQRSPWTDSKFGGGVSGHYETSPAADLEALSGQFLAMRPKSGVMLMWVTGPHAETAPKVMRAWGYTPIKPIFYWVKTYPGSPAIYYGPGAYTGSNIEFIWLGQANMSRRFTPANSGGTKGVNEPVCAPPDPQDLADLAHFAAHPRDDGRRIIHSRKPPIFRDLVTKLFGEHHARVEVFARERIPGWHAIGDQIPGGQLMVPGHIITPLPPPDERTATTRRHERYEQPSLLLPTKETAC